MVGTMITPSVTWKKSVRVVAHRPEIKVKAIITRKITAIIKVAFHLVNPAMALVQETMLLARMPDMPTTEVMATTERTLPS